jgi:hypothetical protein
MEVKILLCLHFATFVKNYFTFRFTVYMLQASYNFSNHYLYVLKFIFVFSKEVKIYLFQRRNVPNMTVQYEIYWILHSPIQDLYWIVKIKCFS